MTITPDTVIDNGTTSPEFLPFWEWLGNGQIAFPRCADCSRNHWYPMQRCPHCGSAQIDWQPVSGTGALYSWTVVRHAFAPEYRDKVPYTVALVEFPDAPGVRLVTQLLEDAAAPLHCGLQVTAVIDNPPGERPTVRFRVA